MGYTPESMFFCFDCSSLLLYILVDGPKKMLTMFRYHPVLVDSPGVDVAQGMDEAIEDVCEDADLFVLVQNAEECPG